MPSGSSFGDMGLLGSNINAERSASTINGLYSINSGDVIGGKSSLLKNDGEGASDEIVREESSDTSSKESHSLSSSSDNDKS